MDVMTETTLWNQSLAAFRDATASAEPTPGGGSVAMVGAALGLGLVIMALEITQRKPEPGTETEVADLLARARKLLDALSRHADEDVAVFRAYMSALKLPKQTDAEKAAQAVAARGSGQRHPRPTDGGPRRGGCPGTGGPGGGAGGGGAWSATWGAGLLSSAVPSRPCCSMWTSTCPAWATQPCERPSARNAHPSPSGRRP